MQWNPDTTPRQKVAAALLFLLIVAALGSFGLYAQGHREAPAMLGGD